MNALPHAASPAAAAAAAGGAEAAEGGAISYSGANDPRFLLAQAESAKGSHDLERARALYSSALAQNANDSEALAGLGDVDRAAHDLPGAAGYYKRALAVNPVYLPALVGLGDVEWESGDRDEAQKTYRDVMDRFPEGTYPGRIRQRANDRGASGADSGDRHRRRPRRPPSAPTAPQRAGAAQRSDRGIARSPATRWRSSRSRRWRASRATGARRRAGPSPPATAAPRSGPEIAVFDLDDGVPEIEAAGFLGVSVHRESFDRFVRAVNDVAKDKDVRGLLVRFGGAQMGIARAEEIGDLLEPIRSGGKQVYCHGDGFSNATLLAAARGCSKIWVSPAGGVEAIGIAAQTIYFHKLLAEELHVTVDFIQMGKFKGAEEAFTRDGPSDEARASLEGTLGGIRGAWMDGLVKGRGREDVRDAAEDGPYSPEAAKQRGLTDEVGYSDDALAAVKKVAGATRDEVRFGHGAGQKDDELGELVSMLAGSHASKAPIALIRASGSIGMSSSGGLLGGEAGITEHEMARMLGRAEKDDAIKALVIRIDSPGGSALASDLIWHEVRKVQAKKPVVVSVGGMAASGGYYISSAANQIFAEPTSILGSIGVVGGKIAIGDALEKIGVHAETFSAKKGPGAAARAAYPSVLTGWDDPTRTRILETMTGIYELFLARVAEGRGTTPDKIAPFAEGRLFSGAQAKEHGLVDELGGLHDAYAKARSLAGLSADAAVTVLEGRTGFLEALDSAAGDDEPDSARAPLAARSGAATGGEPFAPASSTAWRRTSSRT